MKFAVFNFCGLVPVMNIYRAESKYVKTLWRDLIVGDFVHLSCNETIPADILLLRSADPLGICYVETSNLDGESNLKQRQDPFKPTDFTSTTECEQPSNQIYKFNGFLLHQDGTREAISKNNLLLRGCEIRNTDYIEGIVVYAGHETKAMKNNNGPRYKRSELERLMNWDVVWCVVILLVLCLVGAVGSGIWLSTYTDPYAVIFLTFSREDEELKPELEGFINFWSYIIILQVMIPISLYVSIELIKIGQIFFIMQDEGLYHQESDKRIQCRALNITEELGQIQYVMSDKTGTLTENQMIFRRCAVAGVDYGPTKINSQEEQKGFPTPSNSNKDHAECVKNVTPNPVLAELVKSLAVAEETLSRNEEADAEIIDKLAVLDFFINMTVCNTVVVTSHPHIDKMNASGDVEEDLNAGRDDAVSVVSSCYSSRPPTPRSVPSLMEKRPVTEEKPEKPKSARLLPPLDEPTPMDPPTPRFFLAKEESTQVGKYDDSVILDDNANSLKRTADSGIDSSFMGTWRSIPEIRTEAAADSGYSEPVGESKNTFSAEASPRLRRSFGGFGKSLLNLPQNFKAKMRRNKSSDNGTKGPRTRPNPIYEAESPDELSLVYAANAYGFKLLRRQANYVQVEMPNGNRAKYDLLHILPFDAVRKRMSVIVKRPHSKQLCLFCKGADTVMMDLLSQNFSNSDKGQNCIFKSKEYLNLYASYGLRTLCLAKRDLSDEEYLEWSEQHREAELALEDREQLIYESALRIEQNLELLGVTGIEDRLQNDVPETIAALRHAGIKVWVLTGDKIETAVNIAYACRLFSYGMELIQICAKNEADTREMIEHHLDEITRGQNRSSEERFLLEQRRKKRIGLVVDGMTLSYCLHPSPDEKFIELVSRCTSVLCCRATPLQKSNMVRMVKDKLEAKTLAIGDGANDVSMIQSADVGIGINGQEGMQAVMASDFALPRFCFLKRLLLVHGHWCYDRLARIVLYFFYKNALFVFTIFWFQLFCGFSSQNMIDPLYLQLYNLVFTSLPPLLFGVFEKSAPDHLLMDQPKLYGVGRNGLLYKSYSFWINMADALWQSSAVFFVAYWMYQDSDVHLWCFGFLVFSSIVLCNEVHLALEIKSWTVPLAASIAFCVVIYYGFALIYNAIAGPALQVEDPPYWVAQTMMLLPEYWFGLLLSVFIAMLPRLTVKIVSNTLQPSDVLLARMRLSEKRRAGVAKSSARPRYVAWWSKRRKKVSVRKADSDVENCAGNENADSCPTTVHA